MLVWNRDLRMPADNGTTIVRYYDSPSPKKFKIEKLLKNKERGEKQFIYEYKLY